MWRRLNTTRVMKGLVPTLPDGGHPGTHRSLAHWPRSKVRGRRIRVRLTVTYWALFIVSGLAMLVLTVGVWRGTTKTVTTPVTSVGSAATGSSPGSVPGSGPIGIGTSQHASDLHQLLIAAGIALAVMAIPAIALGWVVAGRYLRPLRTITSAARDISATNLHRRLELAGPHDELRELGDTFDDLLARLERAFQSERRFISNASHELRTPLATMRASIDVAMAKPGPVPAQSIALADRLRPELDRIEALLESFLTLARTQHGPDTNRSTVSLSILSAGAIERRSAPISLSRLQVTQEDDGRPPLVTGTETLLARMVDNLVDNAVKHNRPGGWIHLNTTVEGHRARLVVANAGPVLTQGDLQDVTRPFRRLSPERTNSDKGSGLGLSIVEAIVEAHDGSLELHANPGGGLRAVVTFPLAATPIEAVPT
jgi:signal transduction histidine kinase